MLMTSLLTTCMVDIHGVSSIYREFVVLLDKIHNYYVSCYMNLVFMFYVSNLKMTLNSVPCDLV